MKYINTANDEMNEYYGLDHRTLTHVVHGERTRYTLSLHMTSVTGVIKCLEYCSRSLPSRI